MTEIGGLDDVAGVFALDVGKASVDDGFLAVLEDVGEVVVARDLLRVGMA